ncbi:glycoside hydrolase family 3 N-terminal domain-containing protein [Hyphomonas sp.]|uniref:glycoside hydrolase family 3 N-terminal domain-containing protein n=1 Tax=Hyphomonas sp. TaxID=87 RepID=UPI00391B4488
MTSRLLKQASAAALAVALALTMPGCATPATNAAAAPAAAAATPAWGGAELIYLDTARPVADRVEDLLARMTLEEKIVQITTIWSGKTEIFDEDGNFDPAKAAALYPHGIGHFARPNDRQGPSSPLELAFRNERETVELVNAIQKWNEENTRLSIPVLFHEEGLHGYAARGATSFPQAIALASTWDTDLVRQVYAVAGREIRARGAHLVLTPVVDVARDPRWGRTEETYGEDPYLVGEMGVASVLGFQGDTLPLGEGKVLATLKHMTGHGQPESGTNVGPSNLSERLLREVFFPPFEEIIRRTNIRSLMASYNEIDGVPSHGNGWLLNDVLRGEWDFKGGVVSDYWGIDDMQRLHFVEPDMKSAAVRALISGVDFDLPDGNAFKLLPEALAEGLITMDDIDIAVRRMLEIKFQAGLFESRYADADHAEAITANDEARALALETARRAIILLENDGILPLAAGAHRRVAVIGPNAAEVRLGGYSDVPRHVVTMLEGLETALEGKAEIIHHPGVKLVESGDWWQDEIIPADRDENFRMIAEAKRTAANSDIIILFVGGSEATSREGWASDHLGDRQSIDLPFQQLELIDAMLELGKPVVTVLINGQPMSTEPFSGRVNAIVEGWYLGQEGGTAMAEVLFGEVNPGGKLPVTIARNTGQLPLVYNHKPSALRGYLDGPTEPMYPFGFGLSYTSFEIGAPVLSASSIPKDGTVQVSVSVTNTGDRAGDEVVQLYIRDVISSVTRPVKELRGFARVSLEPGETKTATFELGERDFRMWDKNMQRVVEPGEFQIMAGGNSRDVKTVSLMVTE